MKTFVIGDIHGGYKALMQCLERSGFDYEKDQLISLGDIADGWPEVPECVDELLKIKNLIVIQGNHDKWCEDWLFYGNIHPYWLEQGGQATKDSYISSHKLLDEEHKKFFKSMEYYYIDEENRLFVHGGFTHVRGPQDEEYPSTLWWDRSLWEMSLMTRRGFAEHGFDMQHFPKRMKLFKEIFIGHTSTTSLTVNQIRLVKEDTFDKVTEKMNTRVDFPVNNANLWNLDTGGGWGGKLTIMNVETKEFWQSDTVSELYPGVLGRN